MVMFPIVSRKFITLMLNEISKYFGAIFDNYDL